jgi:hypothetical protein
MTRKKQQESVHSDLELNQYRLRHIADELERGRDLQHDAKQFLIDALWRIGEGEDANVVLGVKAKRGQRKTRESAERSFKMRVALAFIATAIKPKQEDGLGLEFVEALDRAAQAFGLSDDTLNQYWKDYPAMRESSFQRPIFSFPDRVRRFKQ